MLIFLCVMCHAQKVGYRYYIKAKNMPDLYYGKPSDPVNAQKPVLCPDDKFLKCGISFDKGVAYVDFWGFKNSPPPNCTNPLAINKNSQVNSDKRYFFDFSRNGLVPYKSQQKVLFAGFNYGLLTIPLKIRPSLNIDSSKNAGISNVPLSAVASFNLGLFLGGTVGTSYISYKGINTFSFCIAAFIGPSAVELKEGNVNSFSTDFKKAISNNKSIVLPAVTYGLASMFAFNNFGLVVSLGFDSPIGKGRDYWYYNEKPWIGLGFVTNLPL